MYRQSELYSLNRHTKLLSALSGVALYVWPNLATLQASMIAIGDIL